MPKITLSAVSRIIAATASILPLLLDGAIAVSPGRASKEVHARFSGKYKGFDVPDDNLIDIDDESDPSGMSIWLRERADEYNEMFPLEETSTVIYANMTPYREQLPGPVQPKCFFWSDENKVSAIFYDENPLEEPHEDSTYMGCYALDGKTKVSFGGSNARKGDPDKQIAVLVVVNDRKPVIIKPLLDGQTTRTTIFGDIYPKIVGNAANYRLRVQILEGPEDTVCAISGPAIGRDNAREYSATVGRPMEREVVLPDEIECRSDSIEQASD